MAVVLIRDDHDANGGRRLSDGPGGVSGGALAVLSDTTHLAQTLDSTIVRVRESAGSDFVRYEPWG
jgi:hypothetical protein